MDLLKFLLTYLKRELIIWRDNEAGKSSCIDMERLLKEGDAETETCDNENNAGTKTSSADEHRKLKMVLCNIRQRDSLFLKVL